MLIKTTRYKWFIDYKKLVLITKISDVEGKIPNSSSLGTTPVFNTKISEVENKFPNHAKYITTSEIIKWKILQED